MRIGRDSEKRAAKGEELCLIGEQVRQGTLVLTYQRKRRSTFEFCYTFDYGLMKSRDETKIETK